MNQARLDLKSGPPQAVSRLSQARAQAPDRIIAIGDDAEPVLIIHQGQVSLGPGLTPDRAAELMLDFVNAALARGGRP